MKLHKTDVFTAQLGDDDTYYIAIDDRAIESHPDIHKAIKARDILAEHEARNGRPTWLVRIQRADLTEWIA